MTRKLFNPVSDVEEAGVLSNIGGGIKKVAKVAVDTLKGIGGSGGLGKSGFHATPAPTNKPPKTPKAPAAPKEPIQPEEPKVPKQIETSRVHAMAHREFAADAWWDKLSDKEKEAYKRAHPGSKYGSGGSSSHQYNRKSVDDAIQSSNRSGKRIGGKEAKMIHGLLRGHDRPDDGTFTVPRRRPGAMGLPESAPMTQAEKEAQRRSFMDDDTPEANKKFKRGDRTKGPKGENAGRVLHVNHPMVVTDKGEFHHLAIWPHTGKEKEHEIEVQHSGGSQMHYPKANSSDEAVEMTKRALPDRIRRWANVIPTGRRG